MEISVHARKIILSSFTVFIIFLTTAIFHQTQTFYKVFARGSRYFEKQRYYKALPFLTMAFKMEPQNSRAATYLLWSYVKSGMNSKARNVLADMQTMSSKGPEFIKNLADAYYALKEYPQAEELYRQILAQREDPDAEMKLAEVLAWQKKYDEAIPILEKLIKSNPGNLKLTELTADAYSWSKRYNQAVELYKKLETRGCNSKEILLKLADALRFSGRDEEAIKLYEKYLKE